jgi:hypothetical protein
MKLWKSLVSVSLIACNLFAVSSQAELVSKVSPQFEESNLYWNTVNKQLGKYLDIPFYFNVPYASFSPVDSSLASSRTAVSATAPLLIDYRKTARHVMQNNPESQLGLRLIVVNKDADRKINSRELGESGLFQTGDIVLSFRKEWYRTLRYSHIQLGISHAGVLYIEKGADGHKYLRNIDMPMDDETTGPGFLNSKHYQGTPLLQVVRPRNLTPEQKSNIEKWIVRLAKVGPAAYQANKIRFNQDYSKPKYKPGQPLKFVGDLARIALGIDNTEMLTNYCSEFAWEVMSLRNCNMDDPATVAAFKTQEAPACITEIFTPMPLLGTITTDGVNSPGATVGLIDGVPLIMQPQTARVQDPVERNKVIDKLIDLAVFKNANGNATNISSGHRAVEEAVLKANPKFYDMLLNYYTLVNDDGAASNQMVLGLRQGFNASQAPNYSPTALMVHGILSEAASAKALDYVGTIFYVGKVQNIDVYSKLRALKAE